MDVGTSSFVSEGLAPAEQKMRVAIIGGGPGGMFTAWHLQAKAGVACDITIFESNNRMGGKIVSRDIPGVGPYVSFYDTEGNRVSLLQPQRPA